MEPWPGIWMAMYGGIVESKGVPLLEMVHLTVCLTWWGPNGVRIGFMALVVLRWPWCVWGVGHMVYVVDCVADLWELLGPLATAGR